MKSKRNIILTGFMGTGKTSVGRILAGRMGWALVDTDALIEERAGKSVADIFAQDGEDSFRRLEREICQQAASGQMQVIVAGGGAPLDPATRRVFLEDNVLVCLTCEPDEIARRLSGDATRPLLNENPVERIQELLAARKSIYDALPNSIDTTHRAPDEVVEEILKLWQNQF